MSDRLLPELARRYLTALREADGVAAEFVVEEALVAGIAPTTVQVAIVGAAMNEIGSLWERAAISVADEHLATAISHRVLVRIYEALSTAPPGTRERIVLAGVAGQQHTLGLRMVADVLEGDGFDVLCLGGDVPVEALRRFVAHHKPAVVGLSCRLALGADTFNAAVDAVREVWPSAGILAGGDGVPPRVARSDVTWVASSADVLAIVRSMTVPVVRPPAPPAPGQRSRPIDLARGHSVESRLLAETEATGDIARGYVRQAQAFRRLALEDPLTGLANRRAFEDAAGEVAVPDREVALLMIDVDRFKQVNDDQGHEAGDRLLCSIADALAATARPGDLVARMGGDEFAVLLLDCGLPDALRVAERMRARVAAASTSATLSIGIGSLSTDVRAALLDADTALYVAKAAGRDAARVAAAR